MAQSITLEDIWQNGKYDAKRVPGFRFLQDGRHYTKLSNNTIERYDIATGELVDVVFDPSSIMAAPIQIAGYTFSSDEQKIVISTDKESIYRRSSLNYFYIYDLQSNTLTAVYEPAKQMNATLSPDGSKVAFAVDNNLFVKDLDSGELEKITTDGKKNAIINGIADWVYEEEFAVVQMFKWSPDSKRIAFVRFDESDVNEFTLTNYRDGLYPEYVTFKYPKVGEKNAVVSMKIYDLDKGKTKDVDLKQSTTDFYLPRFYWTKDPETLCVFTMNRLQNELALLSVKAKNGKSKVWFEEKNKYYIDINDHIEFLENGDFLWVSEMNGYNSLYKISNNGKKVERLIDGDFDMTTFYGYDKAENQVVYQAAKNSPLDRAIYRLDLDNGNEDVLTKETGWQSAQFSSTFDYYVLNSSGRNMPPNYTLYDRSKTAIRVLEDNDELQGQIKAFKPQPIEFFSFENREGTSLNGYLMKPTNFDPAKEYPLLMYLYGGPGSQQVTNQWGGRYYWWFQHLAQKGYVIACVDNRGTGARGEEFKKMTYLELGKFETMDQIDAAKFLGSESYIDASRIAIFGWSYGGYMSSLCLLKGNDVFKAAIAVAPVTNWKWYDSIYTERYMRTTSNNEDGYKNNSPVYFADRLKGNYLLVHGMGDDNVHFQHTAEMANALIAANKQFDTYFYPNRNHGISGDNARLHLFTKMTSFLDEKL